MQGWGLRTFGFLVNLTKYTSVLTDIYLVKQVFHITPLRVILKRKGSDNNGKTEEIHH